jgi:hypothetical protein
VRGKTLQDALIAFAKLSASPNPEKLRNDVEAEIKMYPVQNLFAAASVTDTGKVTARRPGAALGEGDSNEDLILARMFERARLHQGISAQGAIEPARNVLSQEHPVTLGTCLAIVRQSPFVPEDREFIVAKGLFAGMQGDYLSAVHLLIPQVEHIFRWFLAGRGIITSGLDQDGIQDEYDLNRLLHSADHTKVLVEILGESTVFELRGLLVERHGSNLRNMVAHGLLPSAAFFTAPACYFWWLMLRLCVLGILAGQKQASAPEHGRDSS